MVSLVSGSLGVPLATPAVAHSGASPMQPTQWPGYGTQWWDHWWSEVYVTYDVGTCAGTTCRRFYQDELYTFTVGAVFWKDATCYGDGCGKMNPVPYVNDQRCVARCDSDQDPDARGFVFTPQPVGSGLSRTNATFFTYCRYSLIDAAGNWNTCATDNDPNRVETKSIAGFHVMWRATSGDGSVRGSPNGDAYTTPVIPPGYPAPSVNGLLFAERCNASTNCTASFGDFGTAYMGSAGTAKIGSAFSPDPVNLATGNFTAHAEDLGLPGRVLPFSFTRWYNSADPGTGPLGPGWTHSYNWTLTENPSSAVVRRGDGRQDTFTRRPNGTFADPPGVFDVLTKQTDGRFTLALVNGVIYEFGTPATVTSYATAVQRDAPLAYWHLGETTGASAADASGNGFTGTYSGGVALGAAGAFADASTAVGFNGVDARATVPPVGSAPASPALPTGSSARTFEAWIKPTGNGGTLFATNAASGQKFVVQTFQSGGRYYLFSDGVNGSNNLTLTGAQIPPAGIWSHVAFVFDGPSNTWHYYLNGAPTLTGTFPVAINTATPTSATLGDRLDVPQPFNGALDEAAIYASALSASQIASHYNAGVAHPGRLSRITEPAGNQLAFGYAGSDLTTITDTVGRQVSLSYDAQHHLTQLTDPASRRVTYAYDSAGRLVRVTDRLGNAAGETPAAHQWRYAYDGTTPHLVSITDPDGRLRVTNVYANQGRVVQQRDGRNALTTIAYSSGQTVLTDPLGHATTYMFDSELREISELISVSGSNRTVAYSYDAAGNRTSATDRNGNRTDFAYDARGNVVTKTDPSPDGAAARPVTAFQYDSRNNLTQITDALGFVTASTYEPATNLLLSTTRQIDAATAATTTYDYTDPSNPGLPTQITAPRGNTTATPNVGFATLLSYDAQGNLASRNDPDGATTTYTYDAIGRQTSFIDPDGNVSGANPAQHAWTVGYDANDRETSRTDPLGHVTGTGYDGAGNRTSVTDRAGNVTRYVYDANARLIATQQRPDPIGRPTLVYVTSVSRDPNGNATSIQQANGVITHYAFDELDRLLAVTTHPDTQTNLVTSYLLDGNGQPTRKTTGDAVAVTYAYDALARLLSVTGPTVTIRYSYDALGRRTQMTDATGVTSYQYDGLGRMLAAGALTYAYDRDGNRTQLSDSGSPVTYGYSNGGRLLSVTDWAGRISSYSYKPSGLVSSVTYPNGMVATYTYDAAQRLTHLKNGTATATINEFDYTLDAEGNRLTGDNPNTYDGLNRLVSAGGEGFSFDAASNIATYLAPGATNPTQRQYDGANRLVSDGRLFVWSAADRLVQRGLDTFSYDELGRMTQATLGAITFPNDPTGNIDVPAEGATVDPRAPVSFFGWAIDRNAPTGTGVDTVTLYLDGGPGVGTLLGVATYGDSRPDVGTYFNDTRFNNSGWHFNWTVPSSTALGTHSVTAVMHARAEGTTQALTRSFVLALPYPDDPRGNIDAPADGSAVTGGIVSIAGWGIDRNAATGAGLDSVTVYLDGTDAAHLLGTATYGDSRQDVGTYFNDHRLDDSGWHLDWNTAAVPLGQHTFYAVLHSNVMGRSATLTRTVTRALPYADDPRGNIDLPAEASNVPRGTVSVVGWAIDRNAPSGVGIDTVTVYLDGGPGVGTLLGSATLGDSRPDVGTYFNDHRLDTSGWHFDWNTTLLSESPHTLYVVIHGPTYSRTATLTRTVGGNLPYPSDPAANIDVPADNQTVGSGPLTLQGWAIDRNGTTGSGVDRVTVSLDGTAPANLLGTAVLGDSRPDVGTYFNDHRFDASGWHFDWNTSSLGYGTHTLFVQVHSGVTGRTSSFTRTISKPLPFPGDPRGNIDAPAEGATVTGTVSVFGWDIDRNAPTGTGIDSVTVYLDGTNASQMLGTATLSDSRPDVGSYFGDPRLDSSGWHYDWSTTGVPAGSHTLYVIAHSSATGATVTLTRTVTVPVAATQPRGSIASNPTSQTFTYTYDGDGLLRSRSDGTTTTTFVWDPAAAASHVLRVGVNRRVVYGLGPLYTDSSGLLTDLARDGMGNVRAELADGVVTQYSYLAFGAPTGASPSVLGYASEMTDPSGLIFLRSRWFDPSEGAFISADRLEGSIPEPATLNRYAYAAENPLLHADPTGLCTDPGGTGFRYCIDLFIPQDSMLGFGGDNRGASATGGTYRFEQMLRHDNDGGLEKSPAEFGKSVFQPFGWARKGEEGLCGMAQSGAVISATCSGSDGLLYGLAPYVGYGIQIRESLSGGKVKFAAGSGWPSVEVWQYGGGGGPQMLFFHDGSTRNILNTGWESWVSGGGK